MSATSEGESSRSRCTMMLFGKWMLLGSRSNRAHKLTTQARRRLFLEPLESRQLMTVDLALTQVDSPDPVSGGGNVTYTLTLTNSSGIVDEDAAGVQLDDVIPPGSSFVSFDQTSGPTFTLS